MIIKIILKYNYHKILMTFLVNIGNYETAFLCIFIVFLLILLKLSPNRS